MERIKAAFVEVLEAFKHEATSHAEAALTREIMDKMLRDLTKGNPSALPTVTPEQITGAIMNTVGLADFPPEKVEALRIGLNAFFSGDVRTPEESEGDATA